MRTLTSTLIAAQKSLSSRPAVLVQVRNRVGQARRLSWASLYSGSEPDSYHAATCPGDNSLVRVRTDSTVLYRQRVANPGAGSDYSVWTQVPAVLITGKGVALASLGASLALFYVADNVGVVTLYCRESTDNGASFGSPVQVATGAASDFEHLAAVWISSSVLILFYTTGASSQTLNRIIRTSGTWGSSSAWSNSINAITGVSALYQFDVELLISGKDSSSNYLLWGCVYGQGINQANDTWSALKEIRKTHSGTLVSYKYPSIGAPDVLRESFVEVFTGSESYSRVMGLHSQSVSDFISTLHHDDYKLPALAGSYGFAIAYNATHVFLSTSKGLYWASVEQVSRLLTPAVVSVRQRLRPFSPGSLEVILDNSKGTYNTPLFDKGWEVDFQPGYFSTLGAEYSSGQVYFIESLEHITGPNRALFRIVAEEALGLLGRNQSRSAVDFNQSGNLFTYKQLVERFLAYAGISLSVSSNSSTFTSDYPRVTLYAGQSYLSYIDSLYDRLNDLLFIRGTQAININPSSSDASLYSYFASGTGVPPVHYILSGRYSSNSLSANRLQVQGKGVYADVFVQAEIDRQYSRFRAFYDVNADTVAKASAMASALAAKELYHSYGGEISIPVNCGHELYDVIDITDSRVGLSVAKRRIFGLDLLYDVSKGSYVMDLMLGGV